MIVETLIPIVYLETFGFRFDNIFQFLSTRKYFPDYEQIFFQRLAKKIKRAIEM